MFEDPAFDCTAQDFADFMAVLLQAFAKHDTETYGGDKDSRASWLSQFEDWLESGQARQVAADHIKQWAEKNHIGDGA